MTSEERFKITSNDYADLLVNYYGSEANLQRFEGFTIHIMNNRNAIVYPPASFLENWVIQEVRYSAIPSCYGLESMRSLEASEVLQIRRAPVFGLRGQGVLVGIIDTGIDYTNPIFRYSDGTSKIAAIWDQTIESENYPSYFFYGTEYFTEQINQALQTDNPFEIVPSKDEIGHGTALAGIAVGNEVEESNFSGVAPDSELVIVKLKQAKPVMREVFYIPEGVPCYQENDIMWGVQYMVDTARRLGRPLAICIALGSSQGAHDGRGSLSSLIDAAGNFSGIAVSISAGNEGNMRRHYFAMVEREIGQHRVELNVGENEVNFTMELWGAAPSTYSIDITSPSGEYIPRIPVGLFITRVVGFIFERTRISVNYKMVESQVGDQLILMRFQEPTAGLWTFTVYTTGDIPGSFHIWLPMGDFISRSTYFIQSNPYTTVTSPGNASVPITVTAYNPVNSVLYQNASKGYSRTNDIKPELAAPGVNILSPTLEQGFDNVTGTGAAAAHTTGITAMMLEWGIVRGNYPGIDAVEIKQFLIRGARRNVRLAYPNRDWGYGMIDIYNVFNILRSD